MKRVEFEDLWVGATAMVRGGFGRDPAQEVVLVEDEADLKNGRSGVCYTIPTGGSGWAYTHQIDSVSPKPENPPKTLTVGSVELKRTSKHKFKVTYGLQIVKGLTRYEALREFNECIAHELQCEGFFD